MEYLTSAEIAEKWGISDRSVRNYCTQGRIEGALLIGKIWKIPADATKPARINASKSSDSLLSILNNEMKAGLKGGIYHKVQVELTYNSNHIEGSRLTHDQTRYIYETNTIGVVREQSIDVDDIVETVNHFRCIDYMISHANRALSESMIKTMHGMLKTGTKDSTKDWFAVGEYKKMPNEVGGSATCKPADVAKEMSKLITRYEGKKNVDIDDILDFHYSFEKIHPFQDGNGRVGRLIMFKECLRHDIIPFIIDDDLKYFYYRGLSEWKKERGYLRDTCLSAQDRFKVWLDYFGIFIQTSANY